MTVDIEQRVEDLLKHTAVWDETKETLRELLAEHKGGTLDADDAKYIEGLHKKMFPGRNAAAGAPVAAAPKAGVSSTRDMREVKADNDDVSPSSARSGLTAAELIDALREDIANLVIPADMNEREAAEQDLRGEILEALQATLNELAARKES
jgi:hypothetical protein